MCYLFKVNGRYTRVLPYAVSDQEKEEGKKRKENGGGSGKEVCRDGLGSVVKA